MAPRPGREASSPRDRLRPDPRRRLRSSHRPGHGRPWPKWACKPPPRPRGSGPSSAARGSCRTPSRFPAAACSPACQDPGRGTAGTTVAPRRREPDRCRRSPRRAPASSPARRRGSHPRGCAPCRPPASGRSPPRSGRRRRNRARSPTGPSPRPGWRSRPAGHCRRYRPATCPTATIPLGRNRRSVALASGSVRRRRTVRRPGRSIRPASPRRAAHRPASGPHSSTQTRRPGCAPPERCCGCQRVRGSARSSRPRRRRKSQTPSRP